MRIGFARELLRFLQTCLEHSSSATSRRTRCKTSRRENKSSRGKKSRGETVKWLNGTTREFCTHRSPDEWPWIIRGSERERERERERTIPRCFQVQLNVSKRCVPSTPADRLPSSFSSLSLPSFWSSVRLPSLFISLLKPGTGTRAFDAIRRRLPPRNPRENAQQHNARLAGETMDDAPGTSRTRIDLNDTADSEIIR